MNPIATSLFLFSSFFLASACVSHQAQTWEPLVIQEKVELSYSAQLGPRGFDDPTSEVEEHGSSERTTDSESEAVGTPKGPAIHASFTMIQMPLELGRRLLGTQRAVTDTQTGHLAAGILMNDAGILNARSADPCIQALMDSGEATLVTAPSLTCNPGQPASCSVIHETAYVERFDYAHHENSYVADPVIGVARSGLKCVVTLHREKDAGHRIQVELEKVNLVLPIPLFTTRTNAFNAVTIQTPVYSSVKLAGEVKLSKDQILYIAMPGAPARAGEDQKLLLTLIRVTSEN